MKKTKALSFIAALLLSCQLAACSDKSQTSELNEATETVSSSESISDNTAALPIYADPDDLNDAYKVTFTHDYGLNGIREKKKWEFGNTYIMNSTSEVTYFFYSEYADSNYGFKVEYEENDYYLDSGVCFYSVNTAKTHYNDVLSDSLLRNQANAADLFFYDLCESVDEKYYDDSAYSDELLYCLSVAEVDDSSFGLGNSNFYRFKIEPVGGCGNAFSFRENDTYVVVDPEAGYVLEASDILGSDYADSIYSLIYDEAAKNEYIWLDSLKDCIYTDQFSWYLNSER